MKFVVYVERILKFSSVTVIHQRKTSLKHLKGRKVKACSGIGLTFVNSSKSSQLVCRPCGRKIRNVVETYLYIRESLRKEAELEGEQVDNTPTRSKRGLPTTITPERSCSKKVSSIRGRQSSSKKLTFTSGQREVENEDQGCMALTEAPKEDCPLTLDDAFRNLYHLETFEFPPERKKGSEIRVLIGYSSQEIVVKETFDDKTKSLLRALALKKWQTAVNIVFSHQDLMEHVPDALRRKVDTEFKGLSSDCILKGSTPSEIAAFKNKILVHELSIKCPLWYSVTQGACGINSDLKREKAVNVIALSSSVFARFRNPCMSALAYRLSLILFHGGLSYRDTQRLNHLGICMSPDSLVRLQREMGSSCDSKVLMWKRSIEEVISATFLLYEIKDRQDSECSESGYVSKPVEFHEEQVKVCHYYNSNSTYNFCKELLEEARSLRDESVISISALQDALQKLHSVKLPRFRIVGDNIDYYIQARIQSKENKNQSIHWTQQYAILDRVNDPSLDDTHPQKALKSVQLVELLPNNNVQERFKRNCAILVSRVITKHLKCFQHMNDAVIWHIEHPHSEEVSKKSNICCLGLEFKNPNVAGEMAQLLVTNQEKYVPCSITGEDRLPEVLKTIPLHGDQLFEERARNVQYTFQDGINKYDRLEGIGTEFADWHAKMNLYTVEFDLFVSDNSARDTGTSRASMNRVGKTRAARGAKKQFNEYKEFHQSEVEAHICASFMEMLDMSSLDDKTNLEIPDEKSPKDTRKQWLLTLCQKYVDKYMGFCDINELVDKVDGLQDSQQEGYQCRAAGCQAKYVYHSRRVRHELEVHHLVLDAYDGQEKDAYGHFYCRMRCGNVFSTKATRNRHEKTLHSSTFESESPNTTNTTKKDVDKNDYLYNYHRGKLAFGLLLFEFEDTIKEGDGDRLMDVYKFALLFYRCYGHDKYAYITLLTLANVEASLTEFQSNSLKWNRFYNKYGGKGMNIPLDLKMEQLNKLLKSLLRSLGANLDECTATRVANAIEGVELVMESVDKDSSLSTRKGYRSKGKPEKAIEQIVKDLVEKNVFKYTESRAGHDSFPDFKSSLLSDLDYRDFHKWMTGLIKKWSALYQK